jgi:Nuclear protein Es2
MSYEGVSSDNVVLSAIIDRDDEFRMPPPESGYRPKKQLKRKLHSKTVLEEDLYVDALSQIIERDYFPDTAKLRRHLELLNAHDNNNTAAISAIHRQILTEQRRSAPTPSRNNGQSQTTNPGEATDHGTGSEEIVPIDGLTVDDFLKLYTSEDNESFEILQQRDLEKWRQIRHWAYDSDGTEEGDYEKRPGMLMLYHMGGKVLSVQERGKIDALLELPKSVGDDKPNNVDTWRFRVRNNLMFPPSLEDSQYGSNSSNADHSSTSSNQALLCNNPTSNKILDSSGFSASQMALVGKSSVSANRWVGTSSRAAKIIQKGNTSLRNAPAVHVHSGITPSPLEPPHSPSVMSESLSESSSVTYHEGERGDKAKDKAYRFLSMTPSPMPGAGGESPLMTWGVLGGTPLILDPPESINETRMLRNLTSSSYQSSLLSVGLDTHGGGYTGTMYQPPPTQHRELLAQSLAAKEKSRKAAAKDAGLNKTASRPSGMSSSLRKSGSSSGSSVMTSARHKLTPAALSLAARLTGNRQGSSSSVRPRQADVSNPFSSDALTRSYSALGSGSSRRSKEHSSAGRKRDPSSALESPRIHHQSAMNTDNLLHLN